MAKKLDTPEAIETELKEIETGLMTKAETAIGKVKTDIETELKTIKETVEAIKTLPADFDAAKVMKDLAATIEGFDAFQAKYLGGQKSKKDVLSLKDAIGKAMEAMSENDIKGMLNNKSTNVIVPLGAVDMSIDWKEAEQDEKMQRKTDMILSNSLTGTTVLTYNQRQAIIPAQKFNLREVTPTVQSPTGQYVTYSENTGASNNIAAQTEGSSKGNNAYAFTAATLTNPYIAGYSRFSKQLLKFLPFMQNTLSRMLMRDYFKKENAAGMVVLATGTGPTTMGSSASDVLQIINLIGGFANTDYSPSYALINWSLWSRLVALTFGAGYYAGAGLVVFSGNQLSIGGIPIIPASWVTANKCCLVDADYLERVEVEGLNLAFSYEDADNFTKNLITARIECQTAFNLMRTDAVCYADLGSS